MLNSYIRLAVCHHLMPLSRPTRLRGFMKELEERIAQQGTVKPGNVLKVDAFLNHQCDVELFDHMGAAWAEHFKGKTIDKILTIEASGIGIACVVARHFGNVPVVFAKKAQSINLDGDQYTTTVEKGFQGGGDQLREEGYDVDSLAIVESMDPENGTIEFRS